jgi:hypothetical protein
MPTPRQRQFLFAQTGWMLASIAILATVGALTAEYVFVLAFVGLAVVTALTAPVHVTVDWRGRLRWPLLAGALVFLVLAALRTVEKFFAGL